MRQISELDPNSSAACVPFNAAPIAASSLNLQRAKRRRSGTVIQVRQAAEHNGNGKAHPNNDNYRANSIDNETAEGDDICPTLVEEPSQTDDEGEQRAPGAFGAQKRRRKIGEARHDIQKRLQWYYDQKQSKYKHIVQAGRVGFVPLIAASNGAIHKETKVILSMAAHRIADRSGTSASGVMGWLRARVSVAILRAASMQLRYERGGNRRRNLGIYNVANVGAEVFRV
jgi:hypothetical protein